MAHFLNFSEKENSSCLVDIDEITVIHESASGNDVFIFLKSGERISVGRDEVGLAVGQCAQKLVQNGLSLFPVSVAEKGRFFINPTAFTYLVTGVSHIPENETERHVSARIGIEGYGDLETKIPVSTVEKLLDVVRQEGAPIARIDADEASIAPIDADDVLLYYGQEPGYVVYAPRKVTAISEQGSFINVCFTSSSSVDFGLHSEKNAEICRAYGNKIRAASRTDKVDVSQEEKMHAFAYKLEGRLQREFARKVARDAPDLVKLEGAKNILYTRFNDVSHVTMHAGDGPDKKSVVMISYPKDSPNCTGQSHKRAFYETPEAAQKEMTRLQALLGEPS